jgi:predicted Ser/Thr protein kinase
MTQPDALFFALQETLAGKYSIETELGRGGMGIVYLALDVRLDRPVALKVLPQHLSKNDDLRAKFLREARTAAKLSHPNIVPIHSVDEVGDYVFFAMAYIAGETLGERVTRKGPLAPSECMRVLREVGYALNYAHSQGVIHRDIKPDNILLEEGSGRALVADFGIAGIMNESDAIDGGEIVGTVEFMSPEQAAGERVDQRSDLYSLGMVAYYALSGNLPFKSGSIHETLKHVRETPVPQIRSVVKTAPSRLARIVDTCLKKDPAERFGSADNFAEALDVVASSRKQVPVAVRSFLYDPIDLGGDAPAYFTIASLSTFPMFVSLAIVPELGFTLLAGYTVFVLGAPTILVPPRVRRLLASGNTLPDLEIALRQDLEQRKEETPLRTPGRFDQARATLRKASLVGMGGSWSLFWASILAMNLQIDLPIWGPVASTVLLGIGGLSAAGYVAATIGATDDKERRILKKAERRLKFWRSRFGKSLFKLAGIGLRKRVSEVRATHRPTEIQIGLAAEGLFESLPKETRKAVGDVPSTLLRLEADATKLREFLNELNEAEAVGLPRNVRLPADLQEIRESSERHLAEVVAALETIRLGLLRLTTGVGSVEGLTTNLIAAGKVGDNVAEILAGVEEVEKVFRSVTDP